MGNRRCSKCLIPEFFPNARIDGQGVCAYCRRDSTIVQNSTLQDQEIYRNLVADAKTENKRYNCIVCFSGGKDSTYCLYKTLQDGLRPLAFTLDNGFISPQAKVNIAKTVAKLGINHIYFTPSRKTFNAIFYSVLTRPIFQPSEILRLSPVCYACISFVNWMAIELAIEKKCEMIISGFTHGQVPKAVFPNNPLFLGKTFEDMKNKLSQELQQDLSPFYPQIDWNALQALKLYNINPILFEAYNEENIIQTISALGWERPKDTDSCSSNCLLNKVGNHFHYKLYGFHPYQYEISALLRRGSLTREEAERMLAENELDAEGKKVLNELKNSQL